MRKPVVMVKDHPIVKDWTTEMNTGIERFAERHKFLSQQMDKLNEDVASFKDTVWKKIEGYCEEQKLFPVGYNKDKEHLHFDEDLGLIFCCDGDHGNSIGSMIGALLQGKTPT